MSSVFWVSDSTVAYNSVLTYPQTGIGQVFSLFVNDNVEIKNFAINGRSTKSFIEQNRLDGVANKIESGDYLFIQFGHNDEKITDLLRYTTPIEYAKNLKIFIKVAKSKNALPVLITPLARRHFENGILSNEAQIPYVTEVRRVAVTENIALVDLFLESSNFLLKVGEEKSKQLYMNLDSGMFANFPEGKLDNTHLRHDGAVAFALIIAKKLNKLGSPYADMINTGVI